MGKPTPRDEITLQTQVTFEPFDKLGMDQNGPIDPPSGHKKYINVCNDYLRKWVETKAIKVATEDKVVEFLRENLFYKFGYPRELVIDQGTQFTAHMIENLLSQHNIKHKKSTPYHPQTNGQVEVTNKELENILTKVVSSNRKDWANRLVEVIWAYNTTQNETTSFIPYDLVYGKKSLFSIEFEDNTLRMVAQLDLDVTRVQQERMLQLNLLDEFRIQARIHTQVNQVQIKVWHEKNMKEKMFQECDCAVLYDFMFKDFKGKLMTKWQGPYVIEKLHENGVSQIRTIGEEGIPLLFNGYIFKSYKKPLSKEDFVSGISKAVMVIGGALASTSPNS